MPEKDVAQEMTLAGRLSCGFEAQENGERIGVSVSVCYGMSGPAVSAVPCSGELLTAAQEAEHRGSGVPPGRFLTGCRSPPERVSALREPLVGRQCRL